MNPPKDRAPWELKAEEVEKQMAGQEQFEDCLSCRATGRDFRESIALDEN
jgi:hypothetical protein